jgi:hypothetical protein
MASNHSLDRSTIINETGKNLHQWFSELEARGFECIHWKKQVKALAEDYQLDQEWAEYIAEAFCSECGLPWKDQASNGYKVLVTKTFPYSLASVKQFTNEWFEQEKRAQPSKEKANNGDSNFQWLTDDSTVCVKLESKNGDKTRVLLTHKELPSSSDAEIMRNFWRQSLQSMVESL